jgi:hypothetical protein
MVLLKNLFLNIFIVLLIITVAYARDYKVRKKSGNFIVEMMIDRNPPIVDKNKITLEIKDDRGKYITDAKVMVNYYMSPMPGMPPMNYTTRAQLYGHEYRATMDLIMAGPWNVVVSIIRGGRTSAVTFAIDVR